MQHAAKRLDECVLLRIGIGCGDFLVVRVRADFGTVNQDHVVQFLGSGVSRAHAAEHCGIKGMRILLHPSIDSLLSDGFYAKEHKLENYEGPIDVASSEGANRASVAREINYVWHPRHDEKYWKSIREMMQAAPSEQRHHYQATVTAINWMRQALGRPVVNLDWRAP